jgi:hypothetical protein
MKSPGLLSRGQTDAGGNLLVGNEDGQNGNRTHELIFRRHCFDPLRGEKIRVVAAIFGPYFTGGTKGEPVYINVNREIQEKSFYFQAKGLFFTFDFLSVQSRA